jgi:hypothetical protein
MNVCRLSMTSEQKTTLVIAGVAIAVLAVLWLPIARGRDAFQAVVKHQETAVASSVPPATTATIAEAPQDKEAEGRAAVAGFLAYVARFKTSPNRIENGGLNCETSGPDSGFCDDFYRLPDESDTMVSFIYLKRAPAAVRFTVHVSTRVSCAQLGATPNLEWPAEPGVLRLQRAGGRTCSFQQGPLKGLRAVVEDNVGQHGELETGVHVYSEAFRQTNAGFRAALGEDEARAR